MQGAEDTLVPGYRLDRYELVCPIASGGMASVWLARLRGKRGFEKLFAVKTIKTELISDPQYQAMFLDEARIASRIIHPNVAQILELGEQEDILYIVMEYVDGDSLAKIHRLSLKRGSPLPVGVAMRIVAETCAGLHAAHQLKDGGGVSLGVVHRDVSPQNILVTGEGSAKVIDFGLVKARDRSVGETGQGVVKGKIRYMAPEQVGSKEIDHRADVWAAGMCLYELLSGRIPYHDEDDLDVVKRLMGAEPTPPLDVDAPPAIERILAKALVKDPAGRYESCAQMRRAIEGAIMELALAAENEHVAEFLRDTLPELESRRHAIIAKATLTSEPRLPIAEPTDELAPGDIAFAATEVSRRARTSEPPPTVREGTSRAPGGAGGSSSAARPTTTASPLRDQLGDEKGGRGGLGYFVAAAAIVGAGAWILWPRPEAPANLQHASTGSSASATAAPAAASAASTVTPTAAPVDAALATDTDVELDAAADANASRTSAVATRVPVVTPSPSPAATDTAPPARTYNPAWSILTNPPDAALLAPAPTPPPVATEPLPTAPHEPTTPAPEEPK